MGSSTSWAFQSLKLRPSMRCACIFFIYKTSFGHKWTLVLLCVCCTSYSVNFTSLHLLFTVIKKKKMLLYTAFAARFASYRLQFQRRRHNYSFIKNVFHVFFISKNRQSWTHSRVKRLAFKTLLKSSLWRGTDKYTLFYIGRLSLLALLRLIRRY